MYKVEFKNNMGYFETNSNNIGQIDFNVVENIYYYDEKNNLSINVTNLYIDLHKYNPELNKVISTYERVKITLPKGKYQVLYNDEQIQTFEVSLDVETKEFIFKNEGYYSILTIPYIPCHGISLKVFEIKEIDNKSNLVDII